MFHRMVAFAKTLGRGIVNKLFPKASPKVPRVEVKFDTAKGGFPGCRSIGKRRCGPVGPVNPPGTKIVREAAEHRLGVPNQ